jgi:peptide/nickel transport system permease protein
MLLPSSEFGRPIGVELSLSAAFSLAIAAVTVSSLLVASCGLGYFLMLKPSAAAESLIAFLADIIDSIPAVLWVLGIVVAVGEPRRVVLCVGFVMVALPSYLRLIAGEIRNQAALPYVLAATAIGATASRRFLFHMLPNAVATLRPQAIATFASALAIDGAIGLLGLTNRTDLNLGIMLLRGKEQVFLDSTLLSSVVLTFFLIFGTIFWLEGKLAVEPRRALAS